MKSKNPESKATSFFATLLIVVSLIGGVIGIYGATTQYAARTSAINLILMFFGVVAYFQIIPKISTYRRRIIPTIFGFFLLAALLLFAWINGGWHNLYERVTCDLKLDCCLKARNCRISHAFRPLKFVGFNDQFTSADLGTHLTFCRKITENDSAEVAYFELRREKDIDKKVIVSYHPVSTSSSWIIVGNDPKPFEESVQVHPGRLIMPSHDRISRSPIIFSNNSTKIGIRICGVPNPKERKHAIQDSDVAFWKFVSLEKIEVR